VGWAAEGAGRKKKTDGKRMHPHAKRVRIKGCEPLHVTLRLEEEVADVRRWRFFGSIVSSIAGAMRAGFRICAWSIQGGHLHLVVESSGWKALSDAVRGLEIRLARAINRVLSRRGRVIADRYHARPLSTPSEVRNALVYVLQNARKHLAQRGVALRRDWLDKFSSAAAFEGWSPGAARAIERLRAELGARIGTVEGSVSPPRTWLLRTGWRRRGLLATAEVPAA